MAEGAGGVVGVMHGSRMEDGGCGFAHADGPSSGYSKRAVKLWDVGVQE